MAENVNVPFDFDDSGAIQKMNKLIALVEKLEKETDGIGETNKVQFEKAKKALAEYEAGLDGALGALGEYEKETKQADRSTGNFAEKMISAAKETKIFGVSINDGIAKLNNMKKGLSGVSAEITGTNKVLKLFKIALVSTGIGAIVVAFGALVTLLTKTQRGLDFASKAGAVLGSVFDNVIERAASLGDAIVFLLNGDFNNAANAAKRTFIGLGDEILKDAKAAHELESASQSLRDSQRLLNVEYAKSQAQIEELRNIARDENESSKARINATKQALALETELEEKRIKLAEENLRIIREKNGLGESFIEDLENEAQAEIEVSNIRAESDRKRRRDLQLVQSIQRQSSAATKKSQEEEKKRVEELGKEYKTLVEEVEKKLVLAELDGLTGVDRLEKERELAIAELETLKQSVLAKTKELGRELPEGFNASFDKMGDAINASFKKEVTELRGELPSAAATIQSAIEKGLSGTIEPNIKIKIPKQETGNFITGLQDLKANILGALGISEEEAGFIINQLGGIFNNVNSIILSGTEQNIAIQERLIQQIDERISQAQSAVEEEKSLAEKGFANNLSVKKKELDTLQKEREAAEKKRLEFEKKAAKQRLIIDSLQQTSALVTAGAKVISAESSKGILGVAFAIAAIAAFFGIFASIKAQAKSAAAPDKLFKGGRIPTTGRTDKGLGRGHRVEDTNVVVGAGEWVTNAETSHLQNDFFKSLNAGKYNNLPLKQMADAALESKNHLQRSVKGFHKRDKELQIIKIERQEIQQKESFQKALREEMSRLIDFQKGQPQRIPLGGNRYIEITQTNYGKTTKTVEVATQ